MNKKILLCGNPNVGKSTIFNELTSSSEYENNLKKTTEIVHKRIRNTDYELFNLPSITSISDLMDEEGITKNTLLFEKYEKIIYVINATTLEKNLNLLLQILQFNRNIIVCLNMMDDVEKLNIKINVDKLSTILSLPVIRYSPRNKEGIEELKNQLNYNVYSNFKIIYDEKLENKIKSLNDVLEFDLKSKYVSIKILEKDKSIIEKISKIYNKDILSEEVKNVLMTVNAEKIFDHESKLINKISKDICKEVFIKDTNYVINNFDKLLTSKFFGIAIMLIVIGLIFYLTIVLANYPSKILEEIFVFIENLLLKISTFLHIPKMIYEPLIYGIYRIVSLIISIMFPPLVIFFIMYTYTEECGLLPRFAFNFDRIFKCANCQGKQALTLCAGFGCNAYAIIESRKIENKRDRLLAILTNSFIPCSGRLPMIIAIISMFFVNSNNKLMVAFYLLLFILFSIIVSLLTSYILSKTILKEYHGFFTLELPKYKIPKLSNILKESIINKSLSILKRAIKVSLPIGLIMWLLTNTNIGSISIFTYISNSLNGLGKIIGLDGVILLSFILAIQANEIVLPVIIMGYLFLDNVGFVSNYDTISNILINNGWNIYTAASVILFSIMHYPCTTTLLTIKSEVGTKWMIYSFFIPLITGIIFLFLFNLFI